MSDNYADSYFAEAEQGSQDWGGNDASQQTQNNETPQYVSLEQYQALQDKFNQIEPHVNQLQQLQNVFNPGPQYNFDPQAVEAQKHFLQQEGYMTKADYQAEMQKQQSAMRDSAAMEHGFVNSQHVESVFNNAWFTAQKNNDTQTQAQLKSIGQMYGVNPRLAIQKFNEFQSKAQSGSAPVTNQTLGHSTSAQPSSNQPRFNSWQDFQAYKQQNPVEYGKLMQAWMADDSKVPYKTS